jgi:hypothetical protein
VRGECLFRYSLNRPVVLRDPSGLSAENANSTAVVAPGLHISAPSTLSPAQPVTDQSNQQWEYFEVSGFILRARKTKEIGQLSLLQRFGIFLRDEATLYCAVPTGEPGPADVLCSLVPDDPRYQVDPNFIVPLPPGETLEQWKKNQQNLPKAPQVAPDGGGTRIPPKSHRYFPTTNRGTQGTNRQ